MRGERMKAEHGNIRESKEQVTGHGRTPKGSQSNRLDSLFCEIWKHERWARMPRINIESP